MVASTRVGNIAKIVDVDSYGCMMAVVLRFQPEGAAIYTAC